MKRILFVDDEPGVLAGLEGALRQHQHEWEMVFAGGADAAMAAVLAAPFDVVVSDLHMPTMDGAVFLGHVKIKRPAAVRIMMSGQGDQAAVLRGLRVAHQVVVKTCPPATLVNMLRRSLSIQGLIQSEKLRTIMSGISDLPSLPQVYVDLTDAIGKPESSFAAVARIAERDVALVAKLLQVVNSAYFAVRNPVTSVEQTVALLGLETVRSLALSLHVLGSLDRATSVPERFRERLQRSALLSARIAKRLAKDPNHAHQAFTAALLVDLGKIILAAYLPERFAQVLQACEAGMPAIDAERNLLGATHAEMGAYLLGIWGLPFPVIEAVALHHPPLTVPLQDFDTLVAVHVAAALVDELLGAMPGLSHGTAELDRTVVSGLGLERELPAWRKLAAEEAQRTATSARAA